MKESIFRRMLRALSGQGPAGRDIAPQPADMQAVGQDDPDRLGEAGNDAGPLGAEFASESAVGPAPDASEAPLGDSESEPIPFDAPIGQAAAAAVCSKGADDGRRQLQQSLDALAPLPAILEQLTATAKAQSEMIHNFTPVLENLSNVNEDLVRAVQDLAAESLKHTRLLEEVHAALAAKSDEEAKAAGTLARLGEQLENMNRSNAAHVEVMEQIRDRWANAKDNVADELIRQGRKAFGMLAAIIVLLAALVAVAVLRGFVR